MKISATVAMVTDPAETRRRVEAMERAGLDALWTYEPLGRTEAFARAGFLAAATRRVTLGVGVVSPYTRHPAVTAAGAALLAHLSGGRIILLAGAGGRTRIRNLLGIAQDRPLRVLREFLAVLRRLLAGDEVTHAGAVFSLRAFRLEPPAPGRVPIYLTATHEQMLRFAARHADGVFLPYAPPLRYVEWAVRTIRAALPPDRRVEVVADVPLRITDDPAGARRALKPGLAYYLSFQTFGPLPLEKAGYPPQLSEEISRASGVAALVDAGREPLEAVQRGGLARAADLVPDAYTDQCAAIGTVDQCRERLAALAHLGLTEVALSFQGAFDETLPAIPGLREAAR